MKTSYTLRDTWDIFPRNQDPDTRTNEEFLRDLENKLFVKRLEKKILSTKGYVFENHGWILKPL